MLSDLTTAYRGKRVFLTGHTGFKGSWLSLWLERLGAEVTGYALAPDKDPAMFDLCRVVDGITHHVADVRDFERLARELKACAPDIIFHLAAQPIVREAYRDPLGTLSTNIMGTANLLEAVRAADRPFAVIVVTSDKCYENAEWPWGYRENDRLGGKDPYSMSKGATELVVSSWRRSFFEAPDSDVRLASVRAGNVLGGGDWAKDRIVTDTITALTRSEKVLLRNPRSTRPWQHVLEPLGGYLLLGARLMATDGADYCSAWNFGPRREDVCSVEGIVRLLVEHWGGDSAWQEAGGRHPTEANLLSLNTDKAAALLGWTPTWSLEQLVERTVEWYKAWDDGDRDLRALTIDQIAAFEADSSLGTTRR